MKLARKADARVIRFPSVHRSNTPSFHYSITPTFHRLERRRNQRQRRLDGEVARATRARVGNQDQPAGGDDIDPAAGACDVSESNLLPAGQIAHGGVAGAEKQRGRRVAVTAVGRSTATYRRWTVDETLSSITAGRSFGKRHRD